MEAARQLPTSTPQLQPAGSHEHTARWAAVLGGAGAQFTRTHWTKGTASGLQWHELLPGQTCCKQVILALMWWHALFLLSLHPPLGTSCGDER